MNEQKYDSLTEMLPLVDQNGMLVGAATRGECHNGSKLLHPVVHLHVFNEAGQLYLQKRPEWKTVQPGKWDTAVGGHVDLGESVDMALKREAEEELGLKQFEPVLKESYIYESEIEKELVFTYQCISNEVFTPSSETDGGAFWDTEAIEKQLGKGVFTPNFEEEYRRFFLKKNE